MSVIQQATLPDRFIVLVDRSSYEEVQNELLRIGYRWRMRAPRGKGSPETRSSKMIRHSQHAGINCYTHESPCTDNHLWMVRVLSGSRIDIIQQREGAQILTALEFLSLAQSKIFTAVGGPFVLDEYSAQKKPEATFNWRNPMTKKQRSWRFNSRHAGDIDFIKIAADLSYANPVALVRDIYAKKDDQVWLVVHYKPILKARLIDERKDYDAGGRMIARSFLQAVVDRGYPTRDHQATVVRVSLGETKSIIVDLQDLKKLPWPAGEDKKARTIEVSMPKV